MSILHFELAYSKIHLFMSNSFTMGKNVLFKLDCKLLEQNKHFHCFHLIHVSISIVSIYSVKIVDPLTLTSLCCSLQGKKISKAIVTFLNLWSLGCVRSQIILLSVVFQTYFRKTISHLDKSVFFPGNKTFIEETNWKRISLVSMTLYLSARHRVQTKSHFTEITQLPLLLPNLPDLLTHSNLSLAQWQKVQGFFVSPLNHPFILHLKLRLTLWPLEFVSNPLLV